MKSTFSIATVIVLSAALFTNAQTVEKKALTLEGAKRVIAAAVAYAKKNNAPGGVIAVVDEGGHLMALERLDGTFAASADISIGKARTAVLFKRPTKAFEDIVKTDARRCFHCLMPTSRHYKAAFRSRSTARL